jgi:hypothetical protein
MDLTAKVAALEEEVAILKGEIKTILQELRIAVLSRENPFSANGHDFGGSQPARPDSPAFDAIFADPAAAPTPAPPPVAQAPQQVVMIREVPAAVEPISEFVEQPSPARIKRRAPIDDEPELEPETTARPRRWSVHSLAALMAWTQEHSQRFNTQDMGIVLSLARYGGLIDEALESTLEKLAKGLAPDEAPLRATSSDFLLALRQLDALLDAATATAELPARRAS